MARAVAVVSAAPLLLPELAPDLPDDIAPDVERLRRAAGEALRSLLGGPVLVLAPGEPGVADAPRTALAGFGLTGLDVELPGAPDLAEKLRGVGAGDAGAGEAPLGVDASVLVHALAATDPAVPTVVMQVERGDAEGLFAPLGDLDVAVLLAGDLSACLDETSPGYVVAGAREWEAEVVTALGQGDLEALRRADRDAERVGARSWPLPWVAAALAQARGLHRRGCVHVDARGFGRVVAWWT